MAELITTPIESLTTLPIEIVYVGSSQIPDIRVKTPHKGNTTIRLKETHYPFLFGSVSQTDKDSQEVISEIKRLESEARDYLLNEWVEKTLQDNKQ